MISLLDCRARIEAGTLSPADSIRAAQAAIAMRDPTLRAIVCSDPEPLVPEQGPLAGIAVGIKDIIDTADLPTQMGSEIYRNWRPKADAPIVSRLRALGAVPLAKTVTTAFAGLDPAVTVNPHDPGHTPGGSSSGSAAAVGAGLLPLALGTQTGGSVIRPAAFCGVAAIKPSFRLLPTVGVKTFSWALDTLGLFGASVSDIAYALALIAGRPEIARLDAVGSTLRIGLCRQSFAGEADPEAVAALSRVGRALEQSGATVDDLELPERFAGAWSRHVVIQDFEALQALSWEYTRHRAQLPPVVGAQLDHARSISAAEYDDARRLSKHARRQFRDVIADFDAILTYSTPGFAPVGLGSTGDPRFNRLWTLMGVPCVNVPVQGYRLPLGVQVIARFGGDDRALAVAHKIERLVRNFD